MHDNYQDLGFGITRIDTGYSRPGLAACYLMESDKLAAFIDTGTFHSVPKMLQLLEQKNIPRENLAYIMPTHVHLDHAGGAGELMRHLPNAKLVIHPRGARHMVDPSKLTAGATAVYGEEEFRRHFGELVPVDESRLLIAEDNFTLELDGRPLSFLDTPGHARHHYCVYDDTSKGFFTGDTFGISYREFDGGNGAFIFPTTTPVQFDPQAWHQSLDRLMRYQPARMYLTHFGMVTNTTKLADELRRGIDTFVNIARAANEPKDRHQFISEQMTTALLNDLATLECPVSVEVSKTLLEFDIELNTQGLEVWLDRTSIS